MASDFTEKSVQVGGNQVHMLTGGSGDPLVLFHGAGGNSGWLRYVQALADHYTVYIPTHPGYWQSDRPEWLETIADMASFYTWFLEEQGLEGARAIGFSMGGWIAAEVAASCRHAFSKLMLGERGRHQTAAGRDSRHLHHQPGPSHRVAVPRPQASPRIRPDLRTDAHSRAGGDSRRQPRDGRAPVLEALHVRPPAARPAGTGQYTHPHRVGGGKTAWCRWNAANSTAKRYPIRIW